MAKNTNDTRATIIRKGAELVYAQGYNATGIQQIIEAAGVPKGSFYFYFKSKEDFGVELIGHFTGAIGDAFVRYLGDAKLPPIERLDRLFEYFEAFFEDTGKILGCPIGNLSLEMAGTSERLRTRLEEVIDGLISRIESCLEEARQSHVLRDGLNAADAAQAVFHGFEGAILHMKVMKDVKPFRTFRRNIFSYLTADRGVDGGAYGHA